MKKTEIRKIILIKGLLFILLTVFVSAFTITLQGCSILIRDQETVAAKKQEKKDKKDAAEYEKARKQYHKNQSKEAKKQMKQTEKQADNYNKPKKRSLFSGIKCD